MPNDTMASAMPGLPLISVVTVCYNAGTLIDATVISVLGQTYPNIEYVVIDGASTDATVERVRSYGSNIRLISEPDTGIFNAMNKALKVISGDLVFFLNAGDLLARNDVLTTVARVFQSNQQLMMVYGDYLAWYSPDLVRLIRQADQLDRWQLWRRAVCHQTVFARRQLFDQVGGFDEGLPVIADWDWTIRSVLVAGMEATHIPQEIAIYRMGGFSSNREALARNRQIMQRRYFSRAERIVFGIAEFWLIVYGRFHRRDFSWPWAVRKRLVKHADRP